MKEWFSLQRDCDPQVENHWLRDIERRETRRMLCHERRGKGRTRDATTISSLSTWWDLESSKVLPEKFNQEERTHSECGEHHPIGWNSRLNKGGGGKWAEPQHSSLFVSCLWQWCDNCLILLLLSFSATVGGTLKLWAKMNPPFPYIPSVRYLVTTVRRADNTGTWQWLGPADVYDRRERWLFWAKTFHHLVP